MAYSRAHSAYSYTVHHLACVAVVPMLVHELALSHGESAEFVLEHCVFILVIENKNYKFYNVKNYKQHFFMVKTLFTYRIIRTSIIIVLLFVSVVEIESEIRWRLPRGTNRAPRCHKVNKISLNICRSTGWWQKVRKYICIELTMWLTSIYRMQGVCEIR